MKRARTIAVSTISMSILLSLSLLPAVRAGNTGKKEEAVAAIERRRSELTSLSDQVWSFAETALRETARLNQLSSRTTIKWAPSSLQ